MGRDTFDAVLTSSPGGATAGRVVARGTHYKPEIEFGTLSHWDAPPPLKPITTEILNAHGFEDLTGRQYGRLRVMGYLGKINPKKRALWLVRCVCGDYEARHALTIKRADPNDECRVCLDLKIKRKRYEREGGRPIGDFFQSIDAKPEASQ